jgi:hypothetical protein
MLVKNNNLIYDGKKFFFRVLVTKSNYEIGYYVMEELWQSNKTFLRSLFMGFRNKLECLSLSSLSSLV